MHRGEGPENVETEVGMMRLQAEECQGLPDTSSITLPCQADLLKVVQAAAARPQILGGKTDPQWQPGKQPLSRDCHKWVHVSQKKI